MNIELIHLPECCRGCDECEEEFRRHVGGKHPGIKAMARKFDYFTPGEWQYIAVPVHNAVSACKHGALLILERE